MVKGLQALQRIDAILMSHFLNNKLSLESITATDTCAPKPATNQSNSYNNRHQLMKPTDY